MLHKGADPLFQFRSTSFWVQGVAESHIHKMACHSTQRSKVANCSWPAVTLVCLYRNEIHLTAIVHAAVTAVSDGGSSNRWTKMWVKANLQGPSATRPWLHGFAHSSNIGSRKNVGCGIPQILRNMNVSKEKELMPACLHAVGVKTLYPP